MKLFSFSVFWTVQWKKDWRLRCFLQLQLQRPFTAFFQIPLTLQLAFKQGLQILYWNVHRLVQWQIHWLHRCCFFNLIKLILFDHVSTDWPVCFRSFSVTLNYQTICMHTHLLVSKGFCCSKCICVMSCVHCLSSQRKTWQKHGMTLYGLVQFVLVVHIHLQNTFPFWLDTISKAYPRLTCSQQGN